ncbi:hypothetical protein MiAbW_00823 [Microcystis aeruginosa NIES-4325]|uniref:Uncharacterized protein n=1 Tax=Microcystis aeruginosa NIES-4325 TaxID=2569534 RepID=A0A5J4F5M0_MICAE|nr:hypothetical protein MiAbW_00823 [Microcystis aeruginosa NIES-4325]
MTLTCHQSKMTNQLLKALCLSAVTCSVFSAIPAHAAIFTATYRILFHKTLVVSITLMPVILRLLPISLTMGELPCSTKHEPPVIL